MSSSLLLLRLDISNTPHLNPDGKKISGNHIHVFDGHDDSFAYKLDDESLLEINENFHLKRFKTKSHEDLFTAFADFCNCIDLPVIQPSLG